MYRIVIEKVPPRVLYNQIIQTKKRLKRDQKCLFINISVTRDTTRVFFPKTT